MIMNNERYPRFFKETLAQNVLLIEALKLSAICLRVSGNEKTNSFCEKLEKLVKENKEFIDKLPFDIERDTSNEDVEIILKFARARSDIEMEYLNLMSSIVRTDLS